MATAAALFSLLRRSRHSSVLSLPRVISHRPPPLPHSAPLHSRAFSTSSFDDHEFESDSLGVDTPGNSELLRVIADTSAGGDEDIPALPVRALISMLDSYHDLTGFPWWMIIVSSTLALRISLLCPHVLTLHKLKTIGEFFPKLPPPFPPPFSGKSYIRQFLFFRKKRKAVGCPSYGWPLVPVITQLPCFILWMSSIRKMSLAGHPGFDSGGALWFQNLTEFSHGYSGFIFPFLIAGLHYVNVQISFRKPLVEETRDIIDLFAKFYKRYLDFLTVPLAFFAFCVPQGSQLYWITNSSLSLILNVVLRHPAVLAKLGLPDRNSEKALPKEIDASKTTPPPMLQNSSPTASPENNQLDSPEKWQKIPIENLSPEALTTLSIPFIYSNDKESAIPLLKLALDKDPEYVRALVLMGRVLLLKQLNDEANQYFERAISKLSLAGHPTDEEDVDLLILSSQWAGIACERQGKSAEGRAHFERVANMKEPEDPSSKRHYFDGLLLLASSLFDSGQKAEAAKYLRLVVAYNPAHTKFLEQCERDIDITSDLTRSRREL